MADRRPYNPFPYTLDELLTQKHQALAFGIDTTEIELEIAAVLAQQPDR
jgi:hypothetical protein